MPQYAVLIYSRDSAHAPDATPEDAAECDDHAAELLGEQAVLAAYAFNPRAFARSIRADGVTEGPFVDAEQVVAGVYVLEADDLDQAVRIARTNPVVRGRGGGGVEVRPIHSGGTVRPPRG
ncbi:YciI family protein [Amnibacterium kyonggiense]